MIFMPAESTSTPKDLFGFNSSVPFPHTNRPFPSFSKRREGHFHSRNSPPTERSHFLPNQPEARKYYREGIKKEQKKKKREYCLK